MYTTKLAWQTALFDKWHYVSSFDGRLRLAYVGHNWISIACFSRGPCITSFLAWWRANFSCIKIYSISIILTLSTETWLRIKHFVSNCWSMPSTCPSINVLSLHDHIQILFIAGIPFGSVNLLHGVDEHESKAKPFHIFSLCASLFSPEFFCGILAW